MSASPAPTRRRPKDRKQQILTQARELFVERGYRNVSVGMITERVGITPAGLYRHFANKTELLEAVVRESFGDLPIPAVRFTDLDTALALACDMAMERPYLSTLWSREARHLPPELRTEIRTALRETASAYERLLLAARPGLSRAQADLLAWALQSVMTATAIPGLRVSDPGLPALLRAVAQTVAHTPLRNEVVASRAPRTGIAPVSTRERLLTSAMRLFAERGYHETSMAELGAAAEVTGPNLYSYFDNKAAVLHAVSDRAAQALWIDLGHTLAAHDTAQEALPELASGYVRIAAAWSPASVRDSGEPDIIALALDQQREYLAEWIALLRAARPDLDATTARTLPLIAFALVDQLSRTPHLATGATFAGDLRDITLAVLATPAPSVT